MNWISTESSGELVMTVTSLWVPQQEGISNCSRITLDQGLKSIIWLVSKAVSW